MKKFIFCLLAIVGWTNIAYCGQQDFYYESYNQQEWLKLENNSIGKTVFCDVKNNICYLKITQFKKDTYKELLGILEKQQPNKLIIDLRDNSGGFIEPAIQAAGLFITKDKPFISIKYNDGVEKVNYASGQFNSCNVVVLVNNITASAAEAFALGLVEDGFVAVGNTTYGKSAVQRLTKNELGGEKNTVGTFVVNGKDIQTVGIVPQYEVFNSINIKYDETNKKYIKIEIDEQLDKAVDLLGGI